MLGDCLSPPCGSPLEFESILLRLFAKTTTGCVGLKLLTAPAQQEVLDAIVCDTRLTLKQLVQRSIVDDGSGGYALRAVYVTGDQNCYPCGVAVDTETLLKSLFIQYGDCYGIKIAAGAMACTGLESYSVCGFIPTVSQLIKNLLVYNETYGTYLHINQLSVDCANKLPCDLNLTFQQLLEGLIRKITAECFGILNLNAINGLTNEELKECADYLTLEQALQAAITVVDCGYALNVILLGLPV